MQVRAKTRGTGDSGAVFQYINWTGETAIMTPFIRKQTGTPIIQRPLVIENY